MSGCRMTRPVTCRYVSVSCKLLSVMSCRQGLLGSLEKIAYHFLQLALLTCRQTRPIWLRYVDNIFTTVRHEESTHSTNTLTNKTEIQLTREVEENGKLPFLDCLVTRDDNSLRTSVYRKLTHTDWLQDKSSYDPISHKATTIRTLTRQAQLVCDKTNSFSNENKYLDRAFSKTTLTTTSTDETIPNLPELPK